jgi:hypothetical protein
MMTFEAPIPQLRQTLHQQGATARSTDWVVADNVFRSC